ncbi:MAG: ribonuclease III [Gammaproteobacteria bacterium]|nr:ribonuclease III [Gammaproteobacteria bacterium]
MQARLDYHFSNQLFLTQALTHRSAKGQNNERLEFLGDSVLGFVIASALYQRFPKATEGQLTRLRASLVKEKTLAEVGKELELGDILILGAGELKSGGYRRASILSDTVEAILGAILLDSNLETVQKVIQRLFDSRLNHLNLDTAEKDPKTRLQEWLQSRKLNLPEYLVERSEGQDHNKTYWVSCCISERDLSVVGQGTSRRKAEQAAAEKALEHILSEQ